jgi:hypothetical protein
MSDLVTPRICKEIKRAATLTKREKFQSQKDNSQVSNARIEAASLLSSVVRKIKEQSTFGKIVAATFIIISLISTYVTVFGYMSPRISVQPLPAMNPRDATSSEFSVNNQGSFDIYNVRTGFRFINLDIAMSSSGEMFTRKRVGTALKEPQIGDIKELIPADSYYSGIPAMRSATVTMPFSMPEVEDLDVEVNVYYRPAWYPFGRKETFRFITKRSSDGQIHWLPRPDSVLGPEVPAPPEDPP